MLGDCDELVGNVVPVRHWSDLDFHETSFVCERNFFGIQLKVRFKQRILIVERSEWNEPDVLLFPVDLNAAVLIPSRGWRVVNAMKD